MSLEDMQGVFTESYERETQAYCEKTPDFSQWFASGRYQGAEDSERRYDIGLEHTARYHEYATEVAPDETPIKIEGTPAVEVPFDIMVDSSRVIGKIDIITDKGVRDVKTGVKPGDPFQLGTYCVAVELQYDIKMRRGDFWMARAGGPTVPFDLRDWTVERVTDEFGTLNENIAAERFDPKPSQDNCRRCSVATSCEFRQW